MRSASQSAASLQQRIAKTIVSYQAGDPSECQGSFTQADDHP